MKINIIIIIFIIIIFYSPANDLLTDNKFLVLENFEKYSDSSAVFKHWLLRDENVGEASNIYKMKTEKNNQFLNARSEANSVQIAKKVDWDIKSYPVFSWKWRITELPSGANEEARGKNDSGASIYVIFQRDRIPFLSWKYQPVNVIKYVWSTTLPIGKIVKKEKSKAGKIIYEGYFFVVQSGTKNLGKWITEERDILKDYKKVFGDSPKYNPFLIAILSDSNDTKSTSDADYDDILIKK